MLCVLKQEWGALVQRHDYQVLACSGHVLSQLYFRHIVPAPDSDPGEFFVSLYAHLIDAEKLEHSSLWYQLCIKLSVESDKMVSPVRIRHLLTGNFGLPNGFCLLLYYYLFVSSIIFLYIFSEIYTHM